MSDLPELRNGRLPMGDARGGENNRGIDFKTVKLIGAMVVGIAEPIDDAVCGLIPANTPLELRQAARAVNMKQKRARALQTDPAFQSALREAVKGYRECEDPANLAVALAIRDRQGNTPEDRRLKLAAIDHIRGPAPVAVTAVNVLQQKPQCPGYVIMNGKPLARRRVTTRVSPVCGNII